MSFKRVSTKYGEIVEVEASSALPRQKVFSVFPEGVQLYLVTYLNLCYFTFTIPARLRYDEHNQKYVLQVSVLRQLSKLLEFLNSYDITSSISNSNWLRRHIAIHEISSGKIGFGSANIFMVTYGSIGAMMASLLSVACMVLQHIEVSISENVGNWTSQTSDYIIAK
ncbi:unnamed protein product [Orchesella dallaii]|uniref:Uncharacterized protein n=1 Tax=Orchesella dallaii TaxID=48710 RepID=A0ABP1S726_9HEXA